MPPACFSPARSLRNADKSQLPSQRLLGRQTPGGVTPAPSGTGAARGPVESPSPLHSQGLCSSFPEWLLDEVMRLRARGGGRGEALLAGPQLARDAAARPSCPARPEAAKAGAEGAGGEQDSGPHAGSPALGHRGTPDVCRLVCCSRTGWALGPASACGLTLTLVSPPRAMSPRREAEAQGGCTVPSVTAGVNAPPGVGGGRSTLTPRGREPTVRASDLPSCIFLEHESFPATESSRRPPSCARARRKRPWGPSTRGPLRASPGPTRSGGPLPRKAPCLFLTGLPARLPQRWDRETGTWREVSHGLTQLPAPQPPLPARACAGRLRPREPA